MTRTLAVLVVLALGVVRNTAAREEVVRAIDWQALAAARRKAGRTRFFAARTKAPVPPGSIS
jgi:hypothetical protein